MAAKNQTQHITYTHHDDKKKIPQFTLWTMINEESVEDQNIVYRFTKLAKQIAPHEKYLHDLTIGGYFAINENSPSVQLTKDRLANYYSEQQAVAAISAAFRKKITGGGSCSKLFSASWIEQYKDQPFYETFKPLVENFMVFIEFHKK